MNEMDAEVTHLRILANLKTREIVPQFSNSPPTSTPQRPPATPERSKTWSVFHQLGGVQT